MYCPTCRQERLGGFAACVACGAQLTQRAREEVAEDLAHIQFLLNDMGKWAEGEVSVSSRKYIRGRYQQMQSVLKTVLETPAGATAELKSWQQPTEAAAPTPLAVAAPIPLVDVVPPPAPTFAAKLPSAEPLVEPPLAPLMPGFDIPHEPTPDEEVVAEASKWNEVWKPFLYERIGWFIGAFLVLAGAFYFVAVSWSGWNAIVQTMVVFGLTAGYATTFCLVGGLLGRKENFGTASRVLMLNGAAVAPLANLAFNASQGVERVIAVPVALAWAALSAVLFGVAAKLLDEKTRRPMQLLMLLTTASMAFAPMLAPFGSAMLWLNVLPLILVWRIWRHEATRSSEAQWYVVCAPLFLVALFSIRLHVALAQGNALPPVATYAPFIALLLASTLQLRKLAESRSSDALGVAVVSLQISLLFASGFGHPPALFATAALLGFTTWKLSRGVNVRRTGWLYGSYAGALLAYKTSYQLVPGILATLIVKVKALLGYAAAAPFPFNFDAVYALPFVVAGSALAVRTLVRAERSGDARGKAVAEVLLRSTAGASVLFSFVAFAGADMRAALWSVPAFALLNLALGQWLERRYLVLAGSFLLTSIPIYTLKLYGAPTAGVVTGVAALLLALFSTIQTTSTRNGVSAAVGVLATSAVGIAWAASPPGLSGVVSVALAGFAGLLVARNLHRQELISLSTAVGVSAVPLFFLSFHPESAPFSLAVAGAALALMSGREGRSKALTPVTFAAAFIAPLWAWSVQQTNASAVTLLGPTLVVAGLALLELSRRDERARPYGAVLLGLALFPATKLFEPFAFNTPFLSAALLAVAALVSSLLSASQKNEATSISLALTALVGLSISTGLAVVGGDGYIPTAALCTVGVLLTSRSLHPALTVPFATLFALICSAPDGHTGAMLAQAAFISLVALIPLFKPAHQLLLGGKRVATAASLSAAFVLLVCAIKNEPNPDALHLALYATLPLLWLRATKRAWFALLLAPLMAFFVGASSGFRELIFVVPLSVAVITRFVGQLPSFRKLLLDDDERLSAKVQAHALVGLSAVGLVLLAYVLPRELRPENARMLSFFAAGFALAGGAPLWLRLLGATILAAPVPEVRPFLMPALLAVGFLAHHLPKQTHAALGAPADKLTPAVLALIGIAVTFVPYLNGWASNGEVLLTAAAVFFGALLLRQSWMVPVAMLLAASTSLGFAPLAQKWLVRGVELEAFAVMALVGAVCSALLFKGERNERVQAWSRLLGPGFEGDLHVPMWFGGLLPASAAVLLSVSGVGSQTLPLGLALVLGAAALLLLVTKDNGQAVIAALLGAGVVIVSIPFAWVPVALAAYGTVLAAAGAYFEGELDTADALHHAGWVTSLLAAGFCRSLHSLATPMCFLFVAASGWAIVWRRREREPIGWSASLLFGHVVLFHLGVVLSTGKPPTYIFPYISMLSAVMAAVVVRFAGEKVRRSLLVAFTGIALSEIFAGILLLPLSSSETALREAMIAAVGMTVLVVALVRHAVKAKDVAAAYLAQVALLMGYLAVRVHGMVPHSLGTNDAIAALMGGALFSGLYVWARRQDENHVLAKPLWVGEMGLPLLGLFVAPWDTPLVTALLLMGHAAHFAVAAKLTDERRGASLLAVSAFNAALIFAWLGTGFGRPQYYVIPAALSLLLLVRLFRADFSAEVQARLRAFAVTAIYLASAWPVLFDSTWQMLLCALICVAGVGIGVALRIRSYVYLGTGFLMTSIVANLIRFGARDGRLAALFLSLLGLLIFGFMIYLTAQRAQVLQRYERVRTMLASWDA